ncbi:MAG: hypothetical protein EZS28_009090 [Streblomastix strix]|uniref:non-specific serine/threonine protein kinase n=1 Tax=Streblomastix strix TaxID=222440 RepID=A0A5J4WKE8_9EUKA|nr:MAG: hypothetical protein EZS28_009090 [Streblomastix strix]
MTSESDVWSIGVIIIEVITGEHPFEGITQNETLSNISSGKYKPFPDYINGELKIMLETMIGKIPSQRPSVQSLLESNIMQLVSVIEKSNEQKEYQQSNEQLNKENNELKSKVQILEVEKEKEKQEKVNALSKIDKLNQEKIQALSEKDKTIAMKEYEKQKELSEKQKELQEKQKAQSERDQEKIRADTEHAEVLRLTAQITRLNQQLLSVPTSLSTIAYQSIIPDPDHLIQQENKIIRTNKGVRSTVAFNPVITSGIVRFGGFFEKHSIWDFSIGIADSSAVFGSNQAPSYGEKINKTVRYFKSGDLIHIGDFIKGNSRIKENKTIAMEVNMNIIPRTLTFFYDNQEQPVSVTDIPSSIRFYIFLEDDNSSFAITQFENVQYSSANGNKGQKFVQWGKGWKK